jgi:signal transduction histidine kinase
MAWPAAFSSNDAPKTAACLPPVNVPERREALPVGDDLVRTGKLVALGELTPGVAHELNNPLFAILGLVDLLLAESEHGSRAHRRLGVVRETAQDLREVVRALVDFAREPAADVAPVELVETVRETVSLFRRTAAAKDVELEELVGTEPVVVHGSRNEIRQCLVHLLSNACAALPDGGAVEVELTRSGRWATVTLSDSGPGIPDELRDAIFEPVVTTRATGNGLGLAAARSIAERHGGTLELDAAGPGAVFVLRIPVAGEAAAP